MTGLTGHCLADRNGAAVQWSRATFDGRGAAIAVIGVSMRFAWRRSSSAAVAIAVMRACGLAACYTSATARSSMTRRSRGTTAAVS
jgi:hypothetical protein